MDIYFFYTYLNVWRPHFRIYFRDDVDNKQKILGARLECRTGIYVSI